MKKYPLLPAMMISLLWSVKANADTSLYQANTESILLNSRFGFEVAAFLLMILLTLFTSIFAYRKGIRKGRILDSAQPRPADHWEKEILAAKREDQDEKSWWGSEEQAEDTQKHNDIDIINKLLFDNLPLYVCIKETEGNFAYININHFCNHVFDLPPDKIIGKNDFDLFEETIAKELRNADLEAINQPDILHVSSYQVNGLTGKHHTGTAYRKCLTLSSGKTVLFVICTEETELRNARQESRDAAMTLQTLIDQLPIYLYAEDINNDYKHVIINKPCESLWNLPKESIIGKNDYELFKNDKEIEDFRQSDIKIANSNETINSLLPVTDAKGQTKLHKFFRRRLELSGGRNWLLGVAIDVSQEQELLENQKVLNRCFEDILKMGISHDVSIPVLKALCHRLKATRCFLFRHDMEHEVAVPTAEYCAEQEDLSINDVGELKLHTEEPWYQDMSQGDVIGAMDLTQPETLEYCGSWAPVHKRYRIQSMYACRIMVNGTFWGNFGAAYVGHSHAMTDQERIFFKSAAHLLGLMLERLKEHEDLQNSIQELKTVYSLAEIGAELSQSASFEINYKNEIHHKTGRFQDLVPMDGKKWLSPELWILHDDFDHCQKYFNSLKNGEVHQIDLSFRSDYFKERRYYRLRILRSLDKSDTKYYGVIQNVTAITTQLKQLQEESDIWAQVVNSIPTLIFVKNMT